MFKCSKINCYRFLKKKEEFIMKIKICARDLQNMLKTAKGLELRKLDRDVQKGLHKNAESPLF